MMKSLKSLIQLQIMNTFRINEIRYSKDSKLKGRLIGLLGVYVFLMLFVAFYVVSLVYGLTFMNAAEMSPAYLYFIASLLTLFFAFFKATDYLFNPRVIQWQLALPIKRTTFIMSRLILFYLSSLLPTLLICLPGFVAYGILVSFQVSNLIWGLIGMIILPLFPIVIMSILGALVASFASRLKHKQLVIGLLMMFFFLGIMLASMSFTSQGQSLSSEELQAVTLLIQDQIVHFYPPALWFSSAFMGQSYGPFIAYLIANIFLLLAFILILKTSYFKMISRLFSHDKRGQYHVNTLKTQSKLTALFLKEWRHYWSSSIYVMNTLFGPVLMLVLALAMVIMGPDKLDQSLGIEGLSVKVFPFLLGITAAIMPVTSSSISLEGKGVWQLQTLPLDYRLIVKSKLMLQGALTLPFYVLSEIILLIFMDLSLFECLMMLLIPIVMISLTSEIALIINLIFPVYEWESETVVVKQSASVFVSLLVNMVIALVPMVLVFLSDDKGHVVIMWGILGVMTLLSLIAYQCAYSRRLFKHAGFIN